MIHYCCHGIARKLKTLVASANSTDKNVKQELYCQCLLHLCTIMYHNYIITFSFFGFAIADFY